MFYIQTQDGDLPHHHRVFETLRGAKNAAVRFMSENPQAGQISVLGSMHDTHFNMFREVEGQHVTIETLNTETGDVVSVEVVQ